MRRQYTREDYIAVCDYLFEHVPGLTLATDIIVGYSTETDEDFQETMSLLHKYDQPIVNISILPSSWYSCCRSASHSRQSHEGEKSSHF